MDNFLSPDFDSSSITDCGESCFSTVSSTHHDVKTAGSVNFGTPSGIAVTADASSVETEPVDNPPKRLRLSLSQRPVY